MYCIMTKTNPQQHQRRGRSSAFTRMTLSRRRVNRYAPIVTITVTVIAAMLFFVEPNADFGADAFTASVTGSTLSRNQKLCERQRRMRIQERQITTLLQSSSKEDRNEMLLPKLNIRKAIQSSLSAATTLATMILLLGYSAPALANDPIGSSFSSSSSSSSVIPSNTETGSIDVSDLIKSLQPATDNRPQIPFPTSEALQRAAEAANAGQADNKVITGLGRKQQYPVPQENLLRENSFSLPALISMESTPRGAPRPYNGADVLVLQVWTDQPGSTDGTPLGGAKIPISAVVGGFPVRVSLGPQNSLVKTTASSMKSISDDEAIQRWKEYLSSKSLWVQGAVCREGSGTVDATPMCPPEYPKPVLEGLGFSKYIDLSMVIGSVSSSQEQPKAGSGGLRAPVSLVLAAPR